MRAFTGAHPGWLTKARPPACAPDLNAAGGAWGRTRTTAQATWPASGAGQRTAVIKNRLTAIQDRPALRDAFPAQTGLTPRTRTAADPQHRAG